MIKYDLKGIDEKHYSEDIKEFVPKLVPLVKKFYEQFDVTITEVEYKSALGQNTGKIFFKTDTKKPYCQVEIEATNISSAFRGPSERKWYIVLSFSNVYRETKDLLYTDFGLSSLKIIYAPEGSNVEEKFKTIETEREWINDYYNHLNAAEMFIF
jgi:hypothetical protein